MKRISTLAIVAFFFCLSTMAQVVLGDINFSLKEGQTLFLDDWCDNVIITIAKTGTGQGLFMD